MFAGAYQIETYDYCNGRWTADGLEASTGANRFATEAEALAAIASLRALGNDCADAKYRVREVE